VLGEADPAALKLVAEAKAGERFSGTVTRAVTSGPSRPEDLLTQVQVRPGLRTQQMVVQTYVVCTKFKDARYVLRHLRTPQACFDETVDSLNGRTVSRIQVACRRTC
jgi:hypothetical protein